MTQDAGWPGVSSSDGRSAPAGYRLVKLLGRGGMGEVYLADHLALGRQVAVKFLISEKTNDPDARHRLLREAQAAAAVDHPGVCAVHEVGETPDGHAFVVMQYVEGEPLSAVLQRGALPVREALSLCAHIAEALSAAHRQGIVHRDLKPANVIVTPSGRPKLLDLGIAKFVLGAASASGDAPTASQSTADHMVIGTPAYMAPEQIQQRPLDGRCDLFALGVVLYECLTGKRPFEGPTSFETLGNVLHLNPPAPSAWRRELTSQHDELCRRLLAKDPADRFQSGDEVVGAIRVLLPDTAQTSLSGELSAIAPRWRRWWSRRAAALVLSVGVLAAAAGGWMLTPRPLPEVPSDASRWYDQGTEAIRQGVYLTGRRSLEEAVRLFPQHALAHARLAEAFAELDDERAAKDSLLRVGALVPNEWRLPKQERLRLQAVQALVLRDVDRSVALYRELVNLRSDDAGAWLDLGRAQEAAGLRSAAFESYQRAIATSGEYAAAYLRLGSVLGEELKHEEALAAYGEALRLYQAATDIEGETEVLLRRGMFQDVLGELKEARVDLERARSLAATSNAVYQQIRIQLALSSVTASEGAFEQAERLASEAIERALANGLETAAADGLIDLVPTLLQMDRRSEAIARAEQALKLAERRGARRTTARARLQLAAVHQPAGRSADAVALVDAELPFLRANRYRRFELNALSIKARALEDLDQLDQSREIASHALSVAEQVKDDAQIAVAASSLSSVLTSLGRYPEALQQRERAQAIRSRQGDHAALPYDLANRADVLIRLGRFDEANRMLAELETGIASKQPAYVGRARRVTFLRAMAAASQLRCGDVRRFGAQIELEGRTDSAAVLTPAVLAFCDARDKRAGRVPLSAAVVVDRGLARELHYWLAMAALERGDPRAAAEEVARGLDLLGTLSNDELRWRLDAAGAAAARLLDDGKTAARMSASARAALDRLRTGWAADFSFYGQRADVVYLRKQSGTS
jgi:tetratricopeptide (TPR) repeat protein/tRNA A-37 threonylcarbamoyl transferase component Bud32